SPLPSAKYVVLEGLNLLLTFYHTTKSHTQQKTFPREIPICWQQFCRLLLTQDAVFYLHIRSPYVPCVRSVYPKLGQWFLQPARPAASQYCSYFLLNEMPQRRCVAIFPQWYPERRPDF